MVTKTPGPAGRNAAAHTGAAAEQRALNHLMGQGLALVERNYRVARGPSARGGEIDLILRDRDGTLVFVEVRERADADHGSAAATVTGRKQQRIIRAAQHYLMRQPSAVACRFDVVALDGDELTWIPGAFVAR
jgi:putative endonuclease